jgi:hypothetical protein
VPPRSTRFGSLLMLSRVHWVRLGLVSEVKFLTWKADNLLRPVVYHVEREVPHLDAWHQQNDSPTRSVKDQPATISRSRPAATASLVSRSPCRGPAPEGATKCASLPCSGLSASSRRFILGRDVFGKRARV